MDRRTAPTRAELEERTPEPLWGVVAESADAFMVEGFTKTEVHVIKIPYGDKLWR